MNEQVLPDYLQERETETASHDSVIKVQFR